MDDENTIKKVERYIIKNEKFYREEEDITQDEINTPYFRKIWKKFCDISMCC